MKKIIMLLVLLLCFTGCTSESSGKTDSSNDNVNENNIAKGYQKNGDVTLVEKSVDQSIDIANSNVLFEQSEFVALVYIDSIDGGDNYSYVSNEYVASYTYGKMTIKEVYKGSLDKDQEVMYYRLGGVVPYDKYYQGATAVEKEKMNQAETEGNKGGEFVQEKYTNDIDIEVGKQYLVYMVSEKAYKNESNSYAIIGFQGGLREVNASDKARSTTMVYNNFTKEWETLQSIVSK